MTWGVMLMPPIARRWACWRNPLPSWGSFCVHCKALELNRNLPLFLALMWLSMMSLPAQIVINEFSCSNYSLNIAGNNEDFVELYNETAGPVDVGGWYLSDKVDDPTKFEIPAGTVVPPNGYLVIMCSSEALAGNLCAGGFLNTNFRIHQCKDESVVLSDATGTIVGELHLRHRHQPQPEDHSWARETDGTGDWKVCTNPTPNATNAGAVGAMYDGYAPMPSMGEAPGYHAAAMSLALTAPAGMEVYFTLDGYKPTAASIQYTVPIGLFETTVVRAVVVDPSGALAPSFVETNTYFFGADTHTIRVVSVSGDGLEDGAWVGDEPMHIEFFHEDGSFWVEAEGDSNEHGNDSNAYPQKDSTTSPGTRWATTMWWTPSSSTSPTAASSNA